jgi:hypothetical protein
VLTGDTLRVALHASGGPTWMSFVNSAIGPLFGALFGASLGSLFNFLFNTKLEKDRCLEANERLQREKDFERGHLLLETVRVLVRTAARTRTTLERLDRGLNLAGHYVQAQLLCWDKHADALSQLEGDLTAATSSFQLQIAAQNPLLPRAKSSLAAIGERAIDLQRGLRELLIKAPAGLTNGESGAVPRREVPSLVATCGELSTKVLDAATECYPATQADLQTGLAGSSVAGRPPAVAETGPHTPVAPTGTQRTTGSER